MIAQDDPGQTFTRCKAALADVCHRWAPSLLRAAYFSCQGSSEFVRQLVVALVTRKFSLLTFTYCCQFFFWNHPECVPPDEDAQPCHSSDVTVSS